MAVCVTVLLLVVGLVCGDGSAPQYDTIVIGLGSSGTTAATILARAGKRVLALEAQDRVGGRVNTVPFGQGVVELGAEWIHGTHPSRVYDLAVQNNITVYTQGSETKTYQSDGSLANEELLEELIQYSQALLEDPPEETEPVGHYITRKVTDYLKEKKPEVLDDTEFIEEFLKFMDVFMNSYEASNSWNDVNIASNYEDLEGEQHSSWGKNGYKTFFELLLNKYNNGPGLPTLEVKLNTEVTQITWPQDPKQEVQVTAKDGTVYTADNVIVTVSLGVLKERYTTLFSPPLPQEKVTAIDKISFGLLDKVIFAFPTAWWSDNAVWYAFLWKSEDRKNVPLEDVWTTATPGLSKPMGSDNVLTLWTTGEVAKLVETLPEDVVKSKCMALLRRFLGANTTIPDPTAMIRSTWYSNPFTRGSYTYDNLLTAQYPTARADLGAPLADSDGKPRVLFAGEATNEKHFSTVHGAAETGYREAMRLLPSDKA